MCIHRRRNCIPDLHHRAAPASQMRPYLSDIDAEAIASEQQRHDGGGGGEDFTVAWHRDAEAKRRALKQKRGQNKSRKKRSSVGFLASEKSGDAAAAGDDAVFHGEAFQRLPGKSKTAAASTSRHRGASSSNLAGSSGLIVRASKPALVKVATTPPSKGQRPNGHHTARFANHFPSLADTGRPPASVTSWPAAAAFKVATVNGNTAAAPVSAAPAAAAVVKTPKKSKLSQKQMRRMHEQQQRELLTSSASSPRRIPNAWGVQARLVSVFVWSLVQSPPRRGASQICTTLVLIEDTNQLKKGFLISSCSWCCSNRLLMFH